MIIALVTIYIRKKLVELGPSGDEWRLEFSILVSQDARASTSNGPENKQLRNNSRMFDQNSVSDEVVHVGRADRAPGAEPGHLTVRGSRPARCRLDQVRRRNEFANR